jgi:hypothetical protein
VRRPFLSRQDILDALGDLADRLAAQGIDGRIYVVGGAAMALAYQRDRVTRDVDAVFAPSGAVRAAATEVAIARRLPDDWLNDAVKGFVPGTDPERVPVFSRPGLEVGAASARVMLGMKVLAARPELDAEDIETLAGILGLRTADEILDVVSSLYPADRIPPRSQYLVEQLYPRETAGPGP